MSNDIVIDTDIHRNVVAYVLTDVEVIYICNNRSWDNMDYELLISTLSHETIHLVLMRLSREDGIRGRERVKMYRGIDYKLKKLDKKTMSDGKSYHGLDNVDKYLK